MEDIIFDEYDEYELQKKAGIKTSKKHRYSIGFRKCALALALAVSVSTGFSAVPGRFDSMATVEAKKKDNRKPVIKLQGAASLQVTQNESVKIPKATAKDNVDGNLTKKIKVSVKCGKKSYADLAKKIQKNKAVKFTKIGKYVITYTVSDKAKNKATKKRTVTVVAKAEEGKTTEAATTTSPTTQSQTTENKVTTEQVTTVATTTETPTTEAPTTEKDLSTYADIEKVTINGVTYNVASKLKTEVTNDNPLYNRVVPYYENFDALISLNIGIGNNSTLKDCDPDRLMMYFLGKISVRDGNEKEYFDRMIFFSEEIEKPESVPVVQGKIGRELWIHMYYPTENGKLYEVARHYIFYGDYDYLTTSLLNFYQGRYSVLTCNKENEVAIVPTPKNLNWDDLFENETNRKLIFKE